MFYCENCRVKNLWTRGLRGEPTSIGPCESCKITGPCYDVPSNRMGETVLERAERKSPPTHMAKDALGPAGSPWIFDPLNQCEVEGCDREVLRNRRLCEFHAFPAERQKSDRRAAIEATKKKNAKDSD